MSEPVKYEKSKKLEKWLQDLNGVLAYSEKKILKKTTLEPQMPPCFVLGGPRAGSTLLLQWLASTGAFGYASNFLARFYEAPAVGAKIQRMLTDPHLAYKNDMTFAPVDNPPDFFKSDLGNTFGLFAPNSFNSFWKRFFPFGETQQLNEKELAGVDINTLKAELAALEGVFLKPLVLKAQFLSWHIPFLNKQIENSFFIYVRRHPFFMVQSIINARKKVFGNIEPWYGYKPPEYPELRKLSPYKQAAGQVYFSIRAIEKGMTAVPEDQKIIIDYDEFCGGPHHLWKSINNKYNAQGCTFHRDYSGPRQFPASRAINVMEAEKERIVAAWYSLFGENISPKEVA